MIEPRHTTFDLDPAQAAAQSSENARDTLEALAQRPPVRQLVVERYTATGSTSTRIRIGSGGRPWAVFLALAAPVSAQDSLVVCTPILNFVWESTTGSVDVFEPSGLTANTEYRLQFAVMESLS